MNILIICLLLFAYNISGAPIPGHPRCGTIDKFINGSIASTSKWMKHSLTWSIRSFPHPQGISSPDTKDILQQAFQMWTDHIPLETTEVCSTCNADMVIEFASRAHCNGDAFDGGGGVLAHAFFPNDGRIHFDRDEVWTQKNLLLVAVHEIGHALGLAHDERRESIMYSQIIRHDPINVLPRVDIHSIQQLYGSKNKPKQATPDTIRKGEMLKERDALRSKNNLYRAVLQQEGNFVLCQSEDMSPRNIYWVAGTRREGKGPFHVTLQDDGNLVVNDGRPGAIWASRTNGKGPSPHRLVMQDDGNLVVYDGNNHAVWASGTFNSLVSDTLRMGGVLREGDALRSKNNLYRAVLQQEGNFVLYQSEDMSPRNIYWVAGTRREGKGPFHVTLQDDGNLVVNDGRPGAIWGSGTNGKGPSSHRLVMQDDGNLVVYDGNNHAVWASGTDL